MMNSYLTVLSTLLNLSTMVVVILNMHQIVSMIFLVTSQQHNFKGWRMVLQGRLFIANCLDLVLTLLTMCDGPSFCVTLYIMYKLWLLSPLVVETNKQVEGVSQLN